MLKRKFMKANLKTQFTIMNTIYAVIFLLILVVIGMVSITKWRENDLKNEMFVELNRKNSYLLRNSGICTQTLDNISHNQRLLEHLSILATGNYDDILKIMDFYRTEIKSLEKVINSNPILSHIRIYIDSDEALEMMPSIYHLSRASGLDWYDSSDLAEKGAWYFDYADSAGSTTVYSNTRFQTAIVSRVRLDAENYATIEVVAMMDDLFAGLFWNNPDKLTIFVDQNKNIYHENQSAFTDVTYEALSEYVDFSLREFQHCNAKIGELPVMISYLPTDGITGSLIMLQSMKPTKDYFAALLLILSVVVVIMGFFSYQIVSVMVSKLLHNFYIAVDGVKQIQNGNWDVSIPDLGQNEIGELGKQINIMQERIKSLMNESIKKEIIARDSQLHSLQNQINAHFLYNVLESIKMMAVIQHVNSVSDAISTLGDVMRYNINWRNDSATLEEEIHYVNNYIKLINLRSDYKINLGLNIENGLWNVLIPRMTLQPIIENSVKHGFEDLAADTSVYIKAFTSNNAVHMEISDMGSGMTPEKLVSLRNRIYGNEAYDTNKVNGIGLKNIYDRMKLLYNDEFELDVKSELGWFTKIILRIPIRER